MRYNSKALLLLLYSPDPMQPVLISETQLHAFLAKLTKTGLKSILFGLCRQQYVIKHSVSNQIVYSSTSMGREQCQALFPSLNRQSSQVSLLIFKQAPTSDKGFHYLRRACIKAKAVLLVRGVYLFPAGIPNLLKMELTKLYSRAVVILQVTNIESGFDWQTINESLQLWDVTSVYSGISKELSALLAKTNKQNIWVDKQKQQLSALLYQFIDVLAQDTGLVRLTLPEESQPLSILSRLQNIMTL